MGELLALRWRDIDFPREAIHVRASFAKDLESTPKSGSARTVPMVTDVAQALESYGERDHFTGPGDLVFAGPLGGHLDSNRLRKRYFAALTAAGLPAMRFHELPPHLRHARDPTRLNPPSPELARPRRHQNNTDLPALPKPSRGRRAALRGLRDRGGGWACDSTSWCGDAPPRIRHDQEGSARRRTVDRTQQRSPTAKRARPLTISAPETCRRREGLDSNKPSPGHR